MTTKADLLAKCAQTMREADVLSARQLALQRETQGVIDDLQKYTERVAGLMAIIRRLPVPDDYDLDTLPDGVDLSGDEWEESQ